MAELPRRTAICELRRAGNSSSDITKTSGYAKMTVYRVVAKFFFFLLQVKLKEATIARGGIENRLNFFSG